jgi:hypothetical protein
VLHTGSWGLQRGSQVWCSWAGPLHFTVHRRPGWPGWWDVRQWNSRGLWLLVTFSRKRLCDYGGLSILFLFQTASLSHRWLSNPLGPQKHLGGTRIWIQGLTLARQVVYCLSHAFNPFRSGYFQDRVSIFLPRLTWSKILYFKLLLSLGWLALTITPSFFHWGGVSRTFLSLLCWNFDLSDLNFPSSWGYRCEPLA